MEFQISESKEFVPYHNGNGNGHHARKSDVPMSERRVIAWDMEGMNLSGGKKPQHAVLFGCSAKTNVPLVGKNLRTMEMLQSIIDVGQEYPTALHVGYGFKYDANMLIKDLSERQIRILWKNNNVKITDTDGNDWTISSLPGKRFTVTKYNGRKPRGNRNGHKRQKTTVTIFDYSSFFGGQKFLGACEQILGGDLSHDDRQVIEHGKAERGQNVWKDLPEVRHYWEREILLIQRTFEKFRDVMFRAGFALKEWYGPGALANYINALHKIRPHLGAVQATTGYMPKEVHEASKVAFSGGRFELFAAGRHDGPIYSIDINSAYPHALTMVPSLDPEAGEWKHVESPVRIKRFGLYKISFTAPNSKFFEYRPMPLFHRDRKGLISYPNVVSGWYMSPEARMVLGMPGITIHEGWEWHSDESEFPWEFLNEMFQTRKRLGKHNLLSLPFKLGPNSLYGKYAQTVGWNKKDRTPPRSHALPVAAWVTSYCRSMLWDVIRQIPDKVIAVETDSVFTTVNPEELNLTLGDELGEWGADVYDELLYLQSGMYHYKRDGEWSGVRSRGIGRTEYTYDMASNYVRQLVPGEDWDTLTIETKPRFIGAGLALNANNGMKDHCVWKPQERVLTFGETGKRRHIAKACPECREGISPWDAPHHLCIYTPLERDIESQARRLPWEGAHTQAVQAIRRADERDAELITR